MSGVACEEVERFGRSGSSIRKTSAVTDVLAQRLLVLGAFALLCAAVVALAAVERRSQEDPSAALTSANAPAGWNTAFAALAARRGTLSERPAARSSLRSPLA